MPSRYQPFIVQPTKGGLNTADPPTLLPADALTLAFNVEFDTSGTRRKRLGTARYNASQVQIGGSNAHFMAVADFWRFGTTWTGSGTQKFVAATAATSTGSSGTIYKDDGDGVWDSLIASWGDTGSPVDITIGQGYAIFMNGVDRPQTWDQSATANLYTATDLFAFSTYHLRRLWSGGDGGSQSRVSSVFYSAAGDITDITGADAGSISIDEDDGDKLIGLSQPFRNRLYCFKGPNIGSIHEIGGTSTATFTRTCLFKGGAPCISHASIVTTPNDVYWMSNIGIHSLTATDKYGDVEEAYLSRPIQDIIRGLNMSQLTRVRGFSHPSRNIVGWCVPDGGQSTNNMMLVWNYALRSWSIWKFGNLNPASAVSMKTPTTGVPRLYIGGYTGYLFAGDQTTKSDDNANAAYTYQIRTPLLTQLGQTMPQTIEKQYHSVTTYYKTIADAYDVTLDVVINNRTQSYVLDLMSGGDQLDSTFILDSSQLGGAVSLEHEQVITDTGRDIQLTWTQTGVGQDVEIYGYAIRATPAETMPMARN